MYNILIRAFSKSSTPDLALELFVEMLCDGWTVGENFMAWWSSLVVGW
jgi:pentatricopeptide repeat protein